MFDSVRVDGAGMWRPGAGSPAIDVDELERRVRTAAPAEILSLVLRELLPGRVAVVSSFGAESAVLLHMVAQVEPATPVLFIDTGRHFAETLRYRDDLAAHLGLRDLRTVGPTAEESSRLDPELTRAVRDPDGCCAFRKTLPLRRALGAFDAWVSGRKRFQAATRTGLPAVEVDGPRLKVNPLANWRPQDIAAYAAEHRLPEHPLVARGYPSIGCAACTSAVLPHEDPRAGRWRGLDKTECGIHLPAAE